jgi:hypothetical protein
MPFRIGASFRLGFPRRFCVAPALCFLTHPRPKHLCVGFFSGHHLECAYQRRPANLKRIAGPFRLGR